MHDIQSPRTDDRGIEHLLQAKGLTAPRVTPQELEANIVSEHYFTAGAAVEAQRVNEARDKKENLYEEVPPALHLLTFCVLVLRNGFTVTGESACAHPANFDVAIGRNIARDNAVNKVWPLMGYELKTRLNTEDTA